MKDSTTDHDAGADVGGAPSGGPELQVDPESAVNTDLTSSVDAEDLDEDRLGADPLEEGVEPPEDWSAADRDGVTAREQAEGESIDHRLWSERPDTAESVPGGSSDPDARPADDDVPTASTRIEDRDDPGEEYR
ncbi:hypothetical protein [Tomitella fengzijianii]|uniref:hypothetical protein n=1 Tax=Tomitella fengzijianii TaxID=2597660 RepID=UPI001E645ECA|nr:hypothetical protein [Tomitella fengzijianii]